MWKMRSRCFDKSRGPVDFHALVFQKNASLSPFRWKVAPALVTSSFFSKWVPKTQMKGDIRKDSGSHQLETFRPFEGVLQLGSFEL